MTYSDPLSAFDSFFGGDPFEAFAPLFDFSRRRTCSPGVEWFEDDSNFFARVELPGIGKEELSLEYEGELVTLFFDTGETNEKGEKVRHERKLRVPEGIDPSRVEASLKDGLLTLTMPKIPDRKPVAIEIS